VIEVPSTGSIWRVLSAEAYSKEGLNPTAVIFDEVHAQPNDELWNVMALAMGSRIDPLMIGITTAGARTDAFGRDSLGYRLYQYGCKVATGEVVDPSFYFAWWEPQLGAEADHRDPAVWCEGNPAYGDLIDPEDFVSVLPRTPESEFRTKRTNVWVVHSDSAMPHGAWDACADPLPDKAPPPATPCVFMVDGSWRGDCTAIVGATVEENPYVWNVGVWERPDDDPHWRVPILEVLDAIRAACLTWDAVEVNFDPHRWQHSMAVLESEGIPVVEFHTGSLARMSPAWRDFYDGVIDRKLRHDGDLTLARHVENMVLKVDAKGARPVKDMRESTRHIDLGICAIGAYSRAVANQLIVPVVHRPVVIRL
jgi:phage terminase large subunit-like protein